MTGCNVGRRRLEALGLLGPGASGTKCPPPFTESPGFEGRRVDEALRQRLARPSSDLQASQIAGGAKIDFPAMDLTGAPQAGGGPDARAEALTTPLPQMEQEALQLRNAIHHLTRSNKVRGASSGVDGWHLEQLGSQRMRPGLDRPCH